MPFRVLPLFVFVFVSAASSQNQTAAIENSASPTPAAPLRIAWFSELSPEHSFWRENFAFASAVAEDLGVELIPHYVRSDQTLYREMLSDAVTASGDSPGVDGVIFLNIKRQSRALLEIIESGEAAAISNVLTMDYDAVGRPRETYERWIAEIVDDEEQNGYDVATRLFDEARRLGLQAADGTLHVVAIHGKATASASIHREAGFERALSEQADVTLHQSFYAPHWARDEGQLFARAALRRYPETSIIWCTNDDVLLGVLDSAAAAGRVPGEDLVTGSIDGTIDVVKRVASGEVVCTVGGLSKHSGWAVVLLHDYLRGIDFAPDTGVIVRNRSTIVTRENADAYLGAIGAESWTRIDYRRYSKVYTPKLERYDLSLPHTGSAPPIDPEGPQER